MVQFFQYQLLQLVGRLALPGVDAGLFEEPPGVDFRLGQKQPKADVLRRQKLRRRRSANAQMALVLVTIGFKHHRLYHRKSGTAHINCRGFSATIE